MEKQKIPSKKHKNVRFFDEKNNNGNCNNQVTTNVTVNIDQKDDCLSGCFKAISEIFKKK